MFIAQVTDNETATQIKPDLELTASTCTFTSKSNSSNFGMCHMATEHAWHALRKVKKAQ